MQLFVIPLVVVSTIVGIWLLFHWIAQRDMRPAELAEDIERLNHASWQKALTLANQLRDDDNHQLRQDAELCQRLADQLLSRIKEGGTDQERVWLRIYLCRALGDFELYDGLPALLVAARHQASSEDLEVRRAALQAIGILVNRNGRPAGHDDLLPAVVEAAAATGQAPEETLRYDRLRSTAAFVLGLLPDDVATSQLALLLSDSSQDVRYNAAVGLARHGDQRAVPWLIQMLEGQVSAETPENKDLTAQEITQWQATKQQLVITNALRATSRFVAQQPALDLGELQAAVKKVAEDDLLDPNISQEAERVLKQFDASGKSTTEPTTAAISPSSRQRVRNLPHASTPYNRLFFRSLNTHPKRVPVITIG
jgi:HEAT repeat protein